MKVYILTLNEKDGYGGYQYTIQGVYSTSVIAQEHQAALIDKYNSLESVLEITAYLVK